MLMAITRFIQFIQYIKKVYQLKMQVFKFNSGDNDFMLFNGHTHIIWTKLYQHLQQ